MLVLLYEGYSSSLDLWTAAVLAPVRVAITLFFFFNGSGSG